MKERLARSDYRFLAVCVALLGATTWYSARNFYRAFPEASIEFKVGRDEGRALALSFLRGQSHGVDGYRQAASFTFDETAKTFLEREAGLEQANRLISGAEPGTEVRLWRWSYRWFRPLQKEEFRVDITPRGEVAGFAHELPEDAARGAASPDEARMLAEKFLREQAGRDPASLEFVDSSDLARPKRTDRIFTWKQRGFELHDATNRIEVTVLGNEIGGYREYLKVPDQWTRDYSRLRSKNTAASTVDSAVTLLLLGGLIVTIVIQVRRQDIRWRVAGGVAAIGMALSFLSQLNQLPLEEFHYPTTDSYTSFLARQLLDAAIGALGAGGLLFALTAGAEPLYRESFGGQVSIGQLLGLRSLRTKRFFLGSVLGITLTGIFVAYQTGFYIAAYRFGAWSPADVPYSDLLNTRFPWLYVLFGGFLPAVSEEFLFRLFAIPFLKKLLRSTVVALVLAGFIWGFGHAAYPQQPFYIRGVEVGIGGVALGWILLRWGILPALVWHYSVDAMYSAMLLLRSESLYLRLSGAVSAGVIVLPVAVALVAYWRRGGFEPADGLLNADEPKAEEPEVVVAAAPAMVVPAASSLSHGMRWAAAGILLVGLAALWIPVERFGDSPGYTVTKERALAAAGEFVRAQGLDAAAFRHVTYPAARWSGDDSLAGKYFLERLPVGSASALFETNRPIQNWVTRYFRPLDKEEVLVAVHPETARVMGFRHMLPDDRAGADLDADAAVRIAAAFASGLGYDVAGMELKEKESEKQKSRRDHKLVWEARTGDARNVDETRFRVEVGVDGDRPVSLRAYWKAPEVYSRGRSRENFISIVVMVLKFGAITLGMVLALWLTIQSVRQGTVPWRAALQIAIPAALASAAAPLLSIPLSLRDYPTAVPLETFQAMGYVVAAIVVIGAFLMCAGAAALVTSYFPQCVLLGRAEYRGKLAADAAAALAAAAGLAIVVQKIGAILQTRFHEYAIFAIGSPDRIAIAAPSVASVADALRNGLTIAAVLGAVAVTVGRIDRVWLRAIVGLTAAGALLPVDIRTPGELALQYGIAVVAVGAAAAFCLWFARGNPLSYALVLWAYVLRGPVAELLGTPIPAVRMHGWIAAGVVAAVVVWALAPAMRRSSRRM